MVVADFLVAVVAGIDGVEVIVGAFVIVVVVAVIVVFLVLARLLVVVILLAFVVYVYLYGNGNGFHAIYGAAKCFDEHGVRFKRLM